jgi:hypothetical protein
MEAVGSDAIGAGVRELLSHDHDQRPFGAYGEWIAPPPGPAEPPPAPPPAFQIPAADREQEDRERLAREAEPDPIEPEPERYPAKRKQKSKRTPNLDKVRAWKTQA